MLGQSPHNGRCPFHPAGAAPEDHVHVHDSEAEVRQLSNGADFLSWDLGIGERTLIALRCCACIVDRVAEGFRHPDVRAHAAILSRLRYQSMYLGMPLSNGCCGA